MATLKDKIRVARRLEAEARAKTRNLYDADGRADARAIARQLGWRLPTIAKAVGLDVRLLIRNPVCDEFQQSGRSLGKLLELLLYLFGNYPTVMTWLKRPHADLRDSKHRKVSPLDVIKRGDLEVIEGLVDDILTGQPG